MPLLRRKPFIVYPLPEGLTNNSEVFVCQPTGEIFTDYSEFCARVIQCNSLVWACSITGRGEMTYLEALESERQAHELLDQLPKQLRITILYLASVAQRTSFNQLVDDVYLFMKERYFVGETVEFFEDEMWNTGVVQSVTQPTADTVSGSNGKSRDKFSPAAALYDYNIKRLCNSNDIDQHVSLNVKAEDVKRSGQYFTREIMRIFLRLSAVTDARGVWVIKGAVLQEYEIQHMRFESIFVGKPPVFPPSPKKSPKTSPKANFSPSDFPKQASQYVTSELSPKPSTSGLSKKGTLEVKKSRQEKIDKYLQPSKESGSKKKLGPVASVPRKSPKKIETEQLAKRVKEKYIDSGRKRNFLKKQKVQKEELKMQAILEKRKKQEAMLQARAKKREEKLRLDEFMRQWKRQRDDLECEDLKAMPAPVPVAVRTPNEVFGELVMILEFLHSFSNFLKVKKVFPGGLTFDLLERALLDNEVAGPLVDIISMFLRALFALQEKEDDQIGSLDDIHVDMDIDGNMTDEAVRLATAAAGFCKLTHGIDLCGMTLNSLTVSEVLRLHLLASGGRAGENSAKWRYQQRGGYRTSDDPGLQMRIKQPSILRKLAYMSVYELSFEEKLAIITCLMNQVLTYTSVRSEIEERAEQLRVIKAEIRSLQVAEVKREREAHAKRVKERKEAKLKQLKGGTQSNEPQESEVVEIGETAEAADTERQKLDKEFNRRKAEVQKKASKMLTISMSHQLLPLGSDRAHRRYWLFQSVPGLFVEHDPKSAGPCLSKPTPYNPLARGDTLTYVRRLFEEEYCTGSDKENCGTEGDLSRPITSPHKKKLAEKNESVETESSQLWSGGKSPCVGDDEKLASELWGCTASSNCKIHCGDTIQWSFFSKEEDIADLIECLNQRGIRESELRNVLVAELERIHASIRECPLYKLNKDVSPENTESTVRKSSRLAQSYTLESVNLNFPVGTPADVILEQVLRDFILEMEKKISMGSLGSLKVVNIQEWRQAIENGSYKQLCSELKWGPPSGESENNGDKGTQSSGGETYSSEEGETASSQESSSSCSSISILSQGETSGTGTNYDKNYVLSVDSTPVTPQQENSSVKDLACALLQLEQSLDLRYLKKPLGDKQKFTQLYRWENSLMSSTSLSQLYLHANSLDMSIIWSRSSLNAHCCLCRRKGDAEKMLLCDNCNRGHHMYCLKPKLTKIPNGDWFCSSCLEAGLKVPVPTKKRMRSRSPEELGSVARKSLRLSGISPHGECELCGLGGMLIQCTKCLLRFHTVCLVPRPKKISPETWKCPQCKKADEETETTSEEEATAHAVASDEIGAAHLPEVLSVRQRRGCTTATIAKIARFTKRLRSQSWDDEEPSSEKPSTSRRSSRRSCGSSEMSFELVPMQTLLNGLLTHVDAWPFLKPVRKSEVPDYHNIIKRPMDFSTIKRKLNTLSYESNYEFTADVLLVFENCVMFNQVESDEYKAGLRLLAYFKESCKRIGLDLKARSPQTKKGPRF